MINLVVMDFSHIYCIVLCENLLGKESLKDKILYLSGTILAYPRK